MKNATTTTTAASAVLATAQKLAAAPTKRPAIAAEVVENTLVIEFGNGKNLVIDPAHLSLNIRHAATLHGLKQKLVDAAAIARDTTTGLSATMEDKYNAVMEVYERITNADSPTWNKVREAGTGGGSGANGVLLRALMQLTGKTKDEIEAFLDEKTKEQKAALRSNPKVATIIAELQRAKIADSIDTDELLGELDA
jgi:hypothetical protein